MRICLLANARSTHAQRWARYFAGRGDEVHLLSLAPGEVEGVRVHVVSEPRLGRPGYLLGAPRVRALVRRIEPDILHAHYATSYGLLGALAGYRPLIVSTWGSDVFAGAARSRLLRAAVRLALRRADVVCATSRALARATAVYAPAGKRIEITPFGVDGAQFRPPERRPGEPIVGSTRILHAIYGLHHLVDAVAELRGRGVPARLLLVGDGPQRAELAARIAARGLGGAAELRGWVAQPALPAALHEMGLFAMPSVVEEAFGVAALEAAATGLPVVASRAGGLPEVVADGETGLLVPVGDVAALAEALGALIADPGRARRMGAAGRDFVLAHYEWGENAGRMARLYEELAGRGA